MPGSPQLAAQGIIAVRNSITFGVLRTGKISAGIINKNSFRFRSSARILRDLFDFTKIILTVHGCNNLGRTVGAFHGLDLFRHVAAAI